MSGIKKEDFLSLLNEDEKSKLNKCFELNAQKDKSAFSTFTNLVNEVYVRNGQDAPPQNLMGRLWGMVKPQQKKKTVVEEELKPLGDVVRELPFPLGLKASEFSHLHRMRQEGEEDPQFAFNLCATLSVILRLISLISIQSYVSATKAKDPGVNTEIVKALRSATDGKWLDISRQLLKYFKSKELKGPECAAVLQLENLLKTKVKFPKAQEKDYQKLGLKISDVRQNPLQLLNSLISFRNHLNHGGQITKAELDLAAIQMEHILRSLSPLCSYNLLVNSQGNTWLLNGRVPMKSELKIDQELPEDEPHLIPKAGGYALNLSPLLRFKGKDESISFDELYFINSGILERLNYIGFANSSHIDGKSLGSYDAFKQYMAEIPTPPIPKNPKIDFSQFVADRTKLFVGRTDVLDEIKSAVEEKDKSYIILKALAGMGKTAIIAQLHRKHYQLGASDQIHEQSDDTESGDLWIFHFCMNTDGRNSPVVAYRSLIAQICEAFGENPKNHLSTDVDELKDKFTALVNSSKEKIIARGGKKLVIVIDALDEGIGTGEQNIPSCIPEHAAEHVRYILSYRVNKDNLNQKVERELKQLPEDETLQLQTANPLSGLSRDDVELYLRLANADIDAPQAVKETVWKASTVDTGETADPFYLRFVADGAEKKLLNLTRAETIPESLDDAFEQMWINLPSDRDFLIHRVLLTLGVMREFGDDELFSALFNRQKTEIQERFTPADIAVVRNKAGKLLIYDGDRYGLFHDRFRTFLVGEQKDPIAEALGMA